MRKGDQETVSQDGPLSLTRSRKIAFLRLTSLTTVSLPTRPFVSPCPIVVSFNDGGDLTLLLSPSTLTGPDLQATSDDVFLLHRRRLYGTLGLPFSLIRPTGKRVGD